jgi:hypothetical protein
LVPGVKLCRFPSAASDLQFINQSRRRVSKIRSEILKPNLSRRFTADRRQITIRFKAIFNDPTRWMCFVNYSVSKPVIK